MPTVEQIARVCHEANRGWCDATGDYSQMTWDNAESWQRDSAVEGVAVALAGATPEQQHEAWCQAKSRDGWIYGDVKDAEAKTHPCLVPYADLPPEQRAKDALFTVIVNTLKEA
jgi:hypothetical protein